MAGDEKDVQVRGYNENNFAKNDFAQHFDKRDCQMRELKKNEIKLTWLMSELNETDRKICLRIEFTFHRHVEEQW